MRWVYDFSHSHLFLRWLNQFNWLSWSGIFFKASVSMQNILRFIAFLDIQISNWKCKDWQHSWCLKGTNRMDIQYVICNKIAGQKISLIWQCAEQCKNGSPATWEKVPDPLRISPFWLRMRTSSPWEWLHRVQFQQY